jgi:LuxR family transcriptional regulator, maltose regulon positive regulatory protein
VAEFDRALAVAPEPDQYVRLFLDEGAPMVSLLRAAATGRGHHSTAAAHAHRLQRATAAQPETQGTTAEARAATPATLTDALSDRELQVLRLLNTELTGPEIARHLYVSLNTLRTHTKRIFTKLGARNRAAAVRRGRDLGLL